MSWNERPSFKKGPKKPWGDKREQGESRKGGGEGRSERPRSFGDRPPRPFGDRPRGPKKEGGWGKGPRVDRGDKPFGKDRGPRAPFGEKRGPRPEREGDERQPFRPHLAKDELRYHGKNACLALFQVRPKDIIRVYVKRDLSDQFSDLLAFCAKNKKSYHLVSEGDLERLTDTKHHDGIAIIAKERKPLSDQEFFRELQANRQLILFLDGVGNPHNLGAILRTAAHFGLRYVVGAEEELPRISPAANRTAEGGAEHVSLVRTRDPERFFDRLKGMGFQIYAFDPAEKSRSLFDTRLSENAVFVMGAEVSGVSGLVKSLADYQLKIPGTGAVESLNVSVAAALAMAEFRRQATQGTTRIVKRNP